MIISFILSFMSSIIELAVPVTNNIPQKPSIPNIVYLNNKLNFLLTIIFLFPLLSYSATIV